MLKTIALIMIKAISFILTWPFILIARLGLFFGTEELFVTCGQILSLFPGRMGVYLRSSFYCHTLHGFGSGAHVDFGSYFSKSRADIGKRVWIGGNSIIGFSKIGDDAVIGSKVSILSGRRQHNFTDIESGILNQEGFFTCVTIGNNVFIGEQALVMANVGEKSIIGAGSVVVDEIPSYCVAVGNPAKVIKKR